jgi:hypothetical protein
MMLWISSISGSPANRKLDPDVLKHWHEALTERVELLARVPDLADSEVAVRLEGDVILESLRQPVARIVEAADGVVVLLGSHTGRGRERASRLVLRASITGAADGLVVAIDGLLRVDAPDRADLQPSTAPTPKETMTAQPGPSSRTSAPSSTFSATIRTSSA